MKKKKILKNTRDRKERERELNRTEITTRKNRDCRRRSRSRIINPN